MPNRRVVSLSLLAASCDAPPADNRQRPKRRVIQLCAQATSDSPGDPRLLLQFDPADEFRITRAIDAEPGQGPAVFWLRRSETAPAQPDWL